MVALQNIILAVVASSVMVEASVISAVLGTVKRDVDMRGTNNVWDRGTAPDPELSAAFKGCADAIKTAGKKPTIAKAGNVALVSDFPTICGTEAKAYKPSNGMTVTVTASTITLQNAPASFIDAL